MKAAESCCGALDLGIPMIVDGIDNRVGEAYSGFPDRLYVIDGDGKVAFKSGRGPFGFIPAEMEQDLLLLLMDEGAAKQEQAANDADGDIAAGSGKVTKDSVVQVAESSEGTSSEQAIDGDDDVEAESDVTATDPAATDPAASDPAASDPAASDSTEAESAELESESEREARE